MSTFSNSDDLIDVRDVIARYEELTTDLTDDQNDIPAMSEEERTEAEDELATLGALLDELKGNGGDEQWRGDWYPVTLVRDSYFVDYAIQLAEDIGAVDPQAGWPTYCIDWERAACDLRMDYTSVEFDGVTYWTR